jgi:uncharacterized protein (TIGR02246 family)
MNHEQEIVEDVARQFEDCWNRHDMEAFAHLFAADADFVNVVGMWWKNRSEIKEAHRATHATMFKNSQLSIKENAVRFLKPDVAVCRSKWQLTGHTSPSGAPELPRHGILTHVLQKERDRWVIVVSQNTDIVPFP